jgi:hypothetical protein
MLSSLTKVPDGEVVVAGGSPAPWATTNLSSGVMWPVSAWPSRMAEAQQPVTTDATLTRVSDQSRSLLRDRQQDLGDYVPSRHERDVRPRIGDGDVLLVGLQGFRPPAPASTERAP